MEMKTEAAKFRFLGSLEPCEDPRPHPPHQTGRYEAGHVCLARFCLGVEGRTEEGGTLRIEVEDWLQGGGTKPSVARGAWWLEQGESLREDA